MARSTTPLHDFFVSYSSPKNDSPKHRHFPARPISPHHTGFSRDIHSEGLHRLRGQVKCFGTTRQASWRSGDAADCKSVYTGSIPVLASNKIPKALPDTRSLSALIELLQFNGRSGLNVANSLILLSSCLRSGPKSQTSGLRLTIQNFGTVRLLKLACQSFPVQNCKDLGNCEFERVSLH